MSYVLLFTCNIPVVTWGHFFRPILSINNLVLILKPTPQVAEQDDQPLQGEVAQIPVLSSKLSIPISSSDASVSALLQ